jgi:UDP-glucose 4-epimerase
MNNILITGATGFIGSYMVKYLLQHQLTVFVLTRNFQKTSNLPKDIQIIEGDLTKPETLIDTCKNIDTVFHLGGFAHAWAEESQAFANQHHEVNFLGTKNILNESIQSNVKRFIFISSVKAVADNSSSIDENWEKMPISPYGIAKREAEKLVLSAKNHGMHVCVLRPALVYGPEWKGNLANMLRAIDRGFFPPLPKINNARSMISVGDICQAAILAAQHPAANGQTYFVTDGISYSTHDLYFSMCQALGKQIPKWSIPHWCFKVIAGIGDFGKKLMRRRMPFDSEVLSKLFGSAHYNSNRIQEELGFKPIDNLNTVLPKIIKAFRIG